MRLLSILALSLAFAPRASAQGTCPDPGDSKARRPMAKQWFERAQKAQESGDDADAVKAYACSLRMVPHPFTAFNLAKAAEKVGDLQLAAESYKRYLELSPEAQDKEEVEARIAELEAKLDRVREDLEKQTASVLEPERKPEVEPEEGGEDESEPVKKIVRKAAPPPPDPGKPLDRRTWAWISLGGGLGLAGVGTVLNLGARDRMSECKNRFAAGDPDYGEDCDAARPRAYGSYALFAVGAAALATSGWLFFGARSGDVAVVPSASGVSFAFRRSF